MIFVLLPAYNEEKNISQLIEDIRETLIKETFTIVVVNDGSTDNTQSLVEQKSLLPCTLLNHSRNLGLGVSLRDGLTHIRSIMKSHDMIFTLDADNTHRPHYMHQMIETLNKGNDIVVASRYACGGGESGLSWIRSLFSRVANVCMRFLFPVHCLTDYTSGYRLYSAATLQKGFDYFHDDLIQEKGFNCMAELVIKLSFLNTRITEIPFVLQYELKKSTSKMPVLQTVFRYAALWQKLKRIQKQRR